MTHRIHQEECIQKMLTRIYSNETSKGQVSLPTGTGKTRVQVSVHMELMKKNHENSKLGVHVIGAHRLALCNQLLHEFIPKVIQHNLPFDILFVGSDRFNDDVVYSKYKDQGINKYILESTSTTRQEEVKIAYEKSKAFNRHLVIVSTYHSFDKLKVIPNIDICTYDEAHTLIGEQFFNNILEVKNISHNYFFTATRKVQGNFGGMNNEEVFGEVLYEKSPREMIEAGEIVAPRFHTIDSIDDGDFDNHSMLIKTTIEAFKEHRKKIKQCSKSPETIGAKLLITTSGNVELKELIEDSNFINFCMENNINVFSFSSEQGCTYNFQKYPRNSVMEIMQNLSDDQDAILLHIDILTEGIDLPSITGIMPFRELNKTKLLQSIGRASRLLKTDRMKLYSGEISIKDKKNYIKPNCWILIPRFFKSLGDSNSMKDVVRSIVNSYEIPLEEYIVDDQYSCLSDDDLDRITTRDSSTKKDEESDLYSVYENVYIENLKGFVNGKPPKYWMLMFENHLESDLL